jgi:DNA-binding transcriptional LysR family regulator
LKKLKKRVAVNLRFLRTIAALVEHPSLASAANSLGLSHSAVSLQIKSLEDELQIEIIDRSTRPPTLTDKGLALVELAHQMFGVHDQIRSLARDSGLAGRVTIGIVPSALSSLLPPALQRLRAAHPELQINIRSGLSGDLAQSVRTRDIDLAVVTEPKSLPDGLISQVICQEPLDVILPHSMTATSDVEALEHPFIWFSRRTWAGQLIEEQLVARKLFVRPVMEIDSLEAIEALVAHGFGVSITPRRFGVSTAPDNVRRLPFGEPQQVRTLTMISPERSSRRRVADSLLSQLHQLTDRG